MPSALVTNSSIKRMYFDGNYYIYLGIDLDGGGPIFGREDRKSLEYLISKSSNRYYEDENSKYVLVQPVYMDIGIVTKKSKEQEKEQEKE